MSRPARLAAAIVLAAGSRLHAAGGTGTLTAVEAEALLRAAEAARTPFEQGLIQVRVTSFDEGQSSLEGEIDIHIGGPDRLLAVFRSGKQRGRKILAVGERSWLILPKAKNPLPITGQQRLGGAASVADLGRLQLAETYRARPRDGRDTISGEACLILDLVAKNPGVAYPSGVIWIAEADHLPRRLLLRLASGKEAKVLDFVSYRTAGERRLVECLEIHDLLKRRGGATRVEFLATEPREFDPSIFTVEGARAFDVEP